MQTYSVWGLPSAADGARFQAVIDALCAEQNVPSFQPHMTLGGLSQEDEDLSPVLAAFSGLALTPTEIAATPDFTKSLFVRFAMTEPLQAGRAALEGLASFRAGRALDPHVSLCYGPPKHRERLDLAIEALVSGVVRFDRLAVVRITLPVERHQDLKAWQIVSTRDIPG